MAARTSTGLLKLGTRGSKLALAQAHNLRERLMREHNDLQVEIVTVRTSGDEGRREQLGAFVKEIQESLLRGEVDLALHCLKDLPTQDLQGTTFAAYLEREDPRDLFISRSGALEGLPSGALVGTGSLRRTAQLKLLRKDLHFKPLVGNVDTRMRKLLDGEYDAILLAVAGLKRLGLIDSWENSPYSSLKLVSLDFNQMLPAAGQGVLIVETRQGEAVSEMVSDLDHQPTRQCAIAERAFLGSFGTGCSLPVAAYCVRSQGDLDLSGLVVSPDGEIALRANGRGIDPVELGTSLAEELVAQGARQYIEGAQR